MAQLGNTTVNGDLDVSGTIRGGFYKPGDVLHTTFGGGGYVTSSGTRFTFSIPCPPLSADVSGCEVTSMLLTIRQNGNYVINNEDMLSGGTVGSILDATSIRLNVIRNSAPSGVVNNDGCGLVTTLDIKFI